MFAPTTTKFKNADTAMTDSIRVINIAMSFVSLADSASLFVPLSVMGQGWRQNKCPRKFPQISYDENNLYETSGILASYLDSVSLPYRKKCDSSYLANFCSDLTNHGRKMGAAGIGMTKIITIFLRLCY